MGSDAWETEEWKNERKKEVARVKKINKKRKEDAKEIIVNTLNNNWCSLAVAEGWADEMLPQIIKALHWKGEEIREYYK